MRRPFRVTNGRFRHMKKEKEMNLHRKSGGVRAGIKAWSLAICFLILHRLYSPRVLRFLRAAPSLPPDSKGRVD